MDARAPAALVDVEAARRMWAEYAAASPSAVRACPEYTVEHFGDSAPLADELLSWVLEGGKRATSELVDDFMLRGDDLPRIGSHWIACDGRGTPRVILRTVEMRLGTIESADEAFAHDEGDGSRENWLAEHRTYWNRTCAARGEVFTNEHEIVFERFRTVWPPEVADPRDR